MISNNKHNDHNHNNNNNDDNKNSRIYVCQMNECVFYGIY